MKKMMYAAVTWLLAASQIFSQHAPLQVRATGTGNTTGHIANLMVFNPSAEAQTFTLEPCYIPSGGQYQPYIVPTITSVNVRPGSTANIPVEGYCTDIFTPPVPSGHAMPPFSEWLTSDQSPTASSLLDAINNISAAFDQLKKEGMINTPYIGSPEKERESVIQQSFWMHSAALTGQAYKIEDFRKNTIKQFEVSTGQKFSAAPPAERKNVEQGISNFWTTFEAVGVKAKVIKAGPESSDGPIEISVKDNYCDCGNVTLTAQVFIKDPFQPEVACKELGLDGGANTRDTIEHKVLPNYDVHLEITNLVTKCTECNAGQCSSGNVVVTIGSRGMTENKNEVVAAADGKYSMPAKTVAAVPELTQKEKAAKLTEKQKAAENPARIFITVTYDCTKATCKKRSCEKVFELTIPRK